MLKYNRSILWFVDHWETSENLLSFFQYTAINCMCDFKDIKKCGFFSGRMVFEISGMENFDTI